MVALWHRAIGTLSRPSAPIVTGGRAILKTNEIFLNETLLSPWNLKPILQTVKKKALFFAGLLFVRFLQGKKSYFLFWFGF